MMMPVLSAHWENTEKWDEANGRSVGAVVLEFGGWEVTRWDAPEPYGQTNEEYAAEFTAKKLAELFAKLDTRKDPA